MKVDLSVIVTSSRPEFVKECLKGFAAQSGACKFEVIIAGNINGLGAIADNVRIIEVQDSHPNRKRNKGLSVAKSDLVALMDDDAVPCINWIQTAIDSSQQHPNAVLTGPEFPYHSNHPFEVLSHQLLSSQFSEFYKGHILSGFSFVKWYDVPFCNCVFPKKLWEDAEGLDETISWHMDDFHFFYSYRNNIAFLNIPQLNIRHNRYPDTLSGLIKYKWKLRRQTGEKLIHYPSIYWSVYPVMIAIILSLVLFPLFFILFFSVPVYAIVLVFFYFLLTIIIVIQRIQTVSISTILNGVVIITSVHLVSVTALFWGIITTAVSLFLGKFYPLSISGKKGILPN